MPIYEYRCDEGHEVEVMQSITEEPLEKCPECEAPTRRVLHSPAIHFKGSGFHNTDYGTKSRNRAKESGDSGDSGSSAGSNGDSGSGGSESTGSASGGSKDSGSSSASSD
jgi:putative FmdB family regulatory protein